MKFPTLAHRKKRFFLFKRSTRYVISFRVNSPMLSREAIRPMMSSGFIWQGAAPNIFLPDDSYNRGPLLFLNKSAAADLGLTTAPRWSGSCHFAPTQPALETSMT